jgi:hypothetical protein
MKSVTLKLNRTEARLMADNLTRMAAIVPLRVNYAEGDYGDYEYAVDRVLIGLVTLVWHKYFTRLAACPEGGTVALKLPEPHAQALRTVATWVEVDYASADHRQLAKQICNTIHQKLS